MFTMKSNDWGEVTWDDGFWDGDLMLVGKIEHLINAARPVYTIEAAPAVTANSTPDWVAYVTAHAALDTFVTDGVWSGDIPDLPPEMVEYPEDAVA